MPNASIWLPDEQMDHLDDMVKNWPSIDNRSQAIQYLVRNDAQKTHDP